MCHSLIYYGFSLLYTLCSQRGGLLQFVHFKLRMITAFPLRSGLYCTISFCLLYYFFLFIVLFPFVYFFEVAEKWPCEECRGKKENCGCFCWFNKMTNNVFFLIR